MKINRSPFKMFLYMICTGIGLMNHSTLSAQLCANPNTLFAMDNAAKLYPVDAATATVGAVINTPSYTTITSYTSGAAGQTASPSSSNGLGYNSINGKLYYFKRDPGGGNKQFVCFDPLINKYTTLATTPITVSVHSACINFNGTGYYCLDINSNLYYYDIALDAWTFITSNFIDQFSNNVSAIFSSMSTGDMAIDGLNNMWILPSTATNFALYELVAPLPVTAVASITLQQVIAPAKPTPSGKSIYGVAFDATGNLYMSTSAGELYKLSAASGTPALVGTMSPSGMTDLSSCAFPFAILPVTWSYFSGALQNNTTVLLNWAMTAQTGNKGFIVEHSADGTSWKQTGFIQSSATGRSSYSFTDPNTVDGKNFYRLQLANNDGSFAYSTTVVVTIKNTEKISLWPNPVINKLNIRLGNSSANGVYAITLDAGGRAVLKSNLQAGINTINLQSLPAGAYTVQVHFQNGEISNEKLIKQY